MLYTLKKKKPEIHLQGLLRKVNVGEGDFKENFVDEKRIGIDFKDG